MKTATLVGISETVEVTHEYDEVADEVNLIFRGNDELVPSCTRRGFAVLSDEVDAINLDLTSRSA